MGPGGQWWPEGLIECLQLAEPHTLDAPRHGAPLGKLSLASFSLDAGSRHPLRRIWAGGDRAGKAQIILQCCFQQHLMKLFFTNWE